MIEPCVGLLAAPDRGGLARLLWRASRLALLLAPLVLGACATHTARPAADGVYAAAPVAQHLQRDDDIGRCARLLRDADRALDAAGLRDAFAARVPGFPYLRVDRISAALAPPPGPTPQFVAWSHLLAQLDQQARGFESANAASGVAGKTASTPLAALEACRLVLATADDNPEQRVALHAAARVPDDYSSALRALGLYPLTRLAFAAGVADWQAQTVATFALPLAQLPQDGQLLRYAPSLQPMARLPFVQQAPHLGLPVRSEAQLRRLITRHAPLVDVDTASGADRIGALRWEAAGDGPRMAVDVTDPSLYVRLTHTLIAGKPHLQIVYTLWFGARPAARSFDPLAGALDGLLWRVTLDADGEALVYDSIHPCGCYHLFFATSRVQARPAPRAGADGAPEGRFDETLFMPQSTPVDVVPRSRVLLRLAAGTHYLQRVLVVPQDGALPDARPIAYALRDDDELRSLPQPEPPGARRSAFGPDGLVAGSERGERFWFWPMGIDSAGQMRQWGRHATAFVGRRHLDDPTLIERYFSLIGDR